MNYSFELTKSDEVREKATVSIPLTQREIDWFVDNGFPNFETRLRNAILNDKYHILTCRRDGQEIPFYLVCRLDGKSIHIFNVINGPVNGSRYYMYKPIQNKVHNFLRDEGFRTFYSYYVEGSHLGQYHEDMLTRVTSYPNKIVERQGLNRTYVADLTSYTPT